MTKRLTMTLSFRAKREISLLPSADAVGFSRLMTRSVVGFQPMASRAKSNLANEY